jgi:hypothetical protein
MIGKMLIVTCCLAAIGDALILLLHADWGPGNSAEQPDAGPNMGE